MEEIIIIMNCFPCLPEIEGYCLDNDNIFMIIETEQGPAKMLLSNN